MNGCFDCKKIHKKCKAECCGVVPIPKEIYNNNKDKIVRQPHDIMDLQDTVIPLTEDNYCVYLNSDLSCNIYNERPLVCRKFGDESHPMLFCPYLNKEGKERDKKETKKLMKQTKEFINKLKVL